ncbi:hypothetical protein DWG18_03780 [Lysobacter sp. TY2-98]|uniref:hypothetical protein n=1 Tax=Lysobacter sp. TY2-98 TaxID=2290922 RepID=UPI000E1FCC55|nr:hypothetical protein [Lysobacter sp. TY2-98]AXK71498.1 hypothetical protein DWG18_03780 [Lysobacter sp. TY2-98]
MKVQFDDRQIRIRLGKAEFASLREGVHLDVRNEWPDGAWSLALSAGETFHLAGNDGGLDVTLPKADLDALAARLPAKDGLRYAIERPQGALDVTVEVDLHDGRTRTR